MRAEHKKRCDQSQQIKAADALRPRRSRCRPRQATLNRRRGRAGIAMHQAAPSAERRRLRGSSDKGPASTAASDLGRQADRSSNFRDFWMVAKCRNWSAEFKCRFEGDPSCVFGGSGTTRFGRPAFALGRSLEVVKPAPRRRSVVGVTASISESPCANNCAPLHLLRMWVDD
jgi:hypothetical protein